MGERPCEELARHNREERRQDRVRRLRHRQDVGSAVDLRSGIAACHNGRAGLVKAATRQVSVSFKATSRAVPNSMPRPITYIRPT